MKAFGLHKLVLLYVQWAQEQGEDNDAEDKNESEGNE